MYAAVRLAGCEKPFVRAYKPAGGWYQEFKLSMPKYDKGGCRIEKRKYC